MEKKKIWGNLTKRSINHDLHSNLRRRVDGVVEIGLETRVHASRERHAGFIKGRLRHGVVLAEEGEDDGIAHGRLRLRRAKGQTLRSADGDGVRGGSSCWGSDAGGLGGSGRSGRGHVRRRSGAGYRRRVSATGGTVDYRRGLGGGHGDGLFRVDNGGYGSTT